MSDCSNGHAACGGWRVELFEPLILNPAVGFTTKNEDGKMRLPRNSRLTRRVNGLEGESCAQSQGHQNLPFVNFVSSWCNWFFFFPNIQQRGIDVLTMRLIKRRYK